MCARNYSKHLTPLTSEEAVSISDHFTEEETGGTEMGQHLTKGLERGRAEF